MAGGRHRHGVDGGRTVDLAGRPLDAKALRARFEALRSAGLLEHGPKTDRYAPSTAMRQWLEDPTKLPLQADLFAASSSDHQTVGGELAGESNSGGCGQETASTAETPQSPTVQPLGD